LSDDQLDDLALTRPDLDQRHRRRLVFAGVGIILCASAAGVLYYLLAKQRRITNALAVEVAAHSLEKHDHQRARVELDEILRRDPNNRDALFARAEVARHLGDYNTARNDYLHVLSLDPARSDARERLFDLTLQAGARQEAEHHLEKLKEALGSGSPAVLERQARLGKSDRER
jgi:Tfp pilus assembly protein PilF